MSIKEEAKEFAIKAHKNQVRKSEPEKPMIIHPINVANILEEYGFDENVVAAGLLHDVVEDTDYTKEDIEIKFGKDVASLVISATEPNKNLSWEERKQHTINETKMLDLRHKAVICADKISNLEDLRILIETNENYDFSAFKRGFESQKWYYSGIYASLIINEEEQYPLFIRLKKLIDHIFYDQKETKYIDDNIFKDKQEEYKQLLKYHYRKEEVYKLQSVVSTKTPYVIEFTGTPRTGKTSLINNLYDFFVKKGFSVMLLEEFTTSKKYKQEIYPVLKNLPRKNINFEIPKYVLKQLKEAISKNPDIIIVDRSLFDRIIWIDRLALQNGMDDNEYELYKQEYIPLIKENINIIISLYTDSLTALKRDYNCNLSLEQRRFLNTKNIDEYNRSLLNIKQLANKEAIDFHLFDTTNKTQREISFEVVDVILKDMRKKLIDRAIKEFMDK